ncbi:MAG: cell surface protein SprA [Prevotellaceae bacterium]|jgi:cell surface protein SprA|nr:cell surface protein SprA [Prevotellaceae bacterium]
MKSKLKILLILLGGIGIYSAFAVSEENKKDFVDLKQPDNIKTDVEYDTETGNYVLRTKLNDEDITSPQVMSADEYKEYSMQQSMQDYWKQKTAAETREGGKQGFNLMDMQFDIGRGDEIFGPGGIQVKTQGSAELKFGLRKNKIKNPTLTVRSQNPPPSFDFDEKIQLSVRGSVGDKINLEMNYNTEASFDFDQKKINLAYQGKEDEILQKLEAGNVSMPLSGSLITGNSSLFGIRTQLKFGRLTVDAVVSQQESDMQNVNMKNGAQMTNFDITADSYDENRHFFLAKYFRENFDKSMRTYPVMSPIEIDRIEVWITNKRGEYEQNRNIIALADLGENEPFDTQWGGGGNTYPNNNANNQYNNIQYNKNVDNIGDVLANNYGMVSGEDYEKIDKARLLNPSEYTFNPKLGYISLKSQLNADEALAVAYRFTVGNSTTYYKVGEFSTNDSSANSAVRDTTGRLVVKLLKGTDFSPEAPTWALMMKNVYSLGAYQLVPEKFELKIMYQSDSTGLYLNYIPNTPISNQPLLSVLELDRMDNHNEQRPDGFFDFIEGYTVNTGTGRIIFPVIEPFGSHLRKKLGNNPAYDKYVFQELYDSTRVEAQENGEKNKFKLVGRYKGSSGSEIMLNAMNVPRGSVKVTAGGMTLTENVDYTVDYAMGRVTILNSDILSSGQNINVSMENKSYFNTQRKTLLGTHLDYQFNKDFNIGGTIMHLSEKPLTQKVSMGSEPISNTIWGLNASYRTESQWLTNALDKIPLLKATAPSSITFNGEFAQLIPGHSKVIGNYAYIDDFEAAKTSVDIRFPQNWKLASTPADPDLFPEAKRTNDISYGYNRALLAWFTIDPIFTRNNSNTPRHIRNDVDQLSNHFVREIKEQEIFPNREQIYGQSSYLTILNLAYYPTERGQYNLDANPSDVSKGVNALGKLNNPETRWGGIMRKLESSSADFEANNIEYIEFWMMDPFVYNNNENADLKAQYANNGGDLYIDLGNVSEDILKDGKKSFENGLPVDGDMSKVQETVWGRVPKQESLSNGFLPDNLDAQDVGLDGLSDNDEKMHSSYSSFVTKLRSLLDGATQSKMEADPFSPLNDPAGDNYHYFRGGDYDDAELSVLDRYKHYNGTEGNSHTSGGNYSSAATSLPDVEDINGDNTLNDTEKFFQYKIELRPGMDVGDGFIVSKLPASVSLPNGKTETVTWYQFKVPITEYQKRVGSIKNFKSIRFVRMFLTNFEEETHLRFGSLELVRGEWRKYSKNLNYTVGNESNGTLDVSAVNIEENAAKEPVNYILPPGVTRVVDPGQPQIRQENEQAMVLKINELGKNDARAVYKKAGMDMRQYKKLQMFVHAEQLKDDETNLKDYDMTVFLRLGSDQTNNFYEYEIPLKLTPHGVYSNKTGGDWEVWRKENMFDFPFSKLTDVKQQRDRAQGSGGTTLTTPFIVYDTDKPMNKITVVGRPSISDVQVIMIGIRNQSNDKKSGEIWVNELRLSEFNEEGGYAALGNVTVNLSDFGMVSVSGETRSSGFGSIEQNVLGRELDDTYRWNLQAGMDLGRFFPDKAKVRIPFYYTHSQEVVTPKYNPLDQDILFEDALNNVSRIDSTDRRSERQMQDSLKSMAQTVVENRSISFSNVKVDIQSKSPKFYDPTNLSVGYTWTEQIMHDPETLEEKTTTHAAKIAYIYSLSPKPFEPFSKLKPKSLRIIKEIGVNYLPSYISYTNDWQRTFYSYQTRDLTGADNHLPPSFRQDFLWNRNFDLKYDFTRNIKIVFSTGTYSRINEPYARDLYEMRGAGWKKDLNDAVWDSIAAIFRGKGFTPLQYQQTLNVDYNVPINKIPLLDWTNLRSNYTATYNWDRGVNPVLEDGTGIELGNTAISNRAIQFDGRLNFEALYKKSAYLAKVNNRFATSTKKPDKKKEQPKTYTEKFSLKAGEKKTIRHRLNSMDIKLVVSDSAGNKVPLKVKAIDKNSAEVSSKTPLNNLSVNVSNETKEETPLDYIVQATTRMLMMVRNVSGTYKVTNTMALPSFLPGTGIIGQDEFWRSNSAPGYDFVFGVFDNDNYIKKAHNNKWLASNDINPITVNRTTDLQLRATVEPIRALKIELTAARATSEAQIVRLDNNEELIRKTSGSFSVSQIGSMHLFSQPNLFENFKNYLIDVNEQLGQGRYSPYSADVLVPAFLAAYTDKSSPKLNSKTEENLFPALKKMLPNWRVTYNGLSNIEAVKKYLKSINLTHGYRCTYNVGAYNRDYEGRYEIGAVTITETFSPLIGVEIATKNDVSARVEYRRSRTTNLNISSIQVIESNNDEWVIGMGYKLKNFDAILRIKKKQTKVSNDLTLRGDVSIKNIKTVIQKIEIIDLSNTANPVEYYSQPTAGSKGLNWRFTADYVFSEKVTIGLYYNHTFNTPYISTSYPTESYEFGTLLRFILTR